MGVYRVARLQNKCLLCPELLLHPIPGAYLAGEMRHPFLKRTVRCMVELSFLVVIYPFFFLERWHYSMSELGKILGICQPNHSHAHFYMTWIKKRKLKYLARTSRSVEAGWLQSPYIRTPGPLLAMFAEELSLNQTV